MSNQPFLYDEQENVLRQRADMKEPKEHPADYSEHTNLYQYWYREWTAYNEHLASLPAYTPVSGWVPEVGKEYIFGEHFSVKRLNPQFREDETYEEYLKCFEEGYRFQPYTKEYFTLYRDAKVAVPIEQKQECKHEPMVDTGVGYYHCPACDWSCTYQEYEAGHTSKKEKGFTLQDMIECWEAGRKSGFWTPILSRTDKKQYFKTKFNINIDDQGK